MDPMYIETPCIHACMYVCVCVRVPVCVCVCEGVYECTYVCVKNNNITNYKHRTVIY